jgi:hypothetical protein
VKSNGFDNHLRYVEIEISNYDKLAKIKEFYDKK